MASDRRGHVAARLYHNVVDPSTSVSRNVIVPEGSTNEAA
jgi:hypothetical protein